jgi:hypothetical protein
MSVLRHPFSQQLSYITGWLDVNKTQQEDPATVRALSAAFKPVGVSHCCYHLPSVLVSPLASCEIDLSSGVAGMFAGPISSLTRSSPQSSDWRGLQTRGASAALYMEKHWVSAR